MRFRDSLMVAANARPGTKLPAGWTPASITSATLRDIIDFENNASITPGTGTVAAITGSVSGASFAQGTAGFQPLLGVSPTTGRQVATFDGTDDRLEYVGIPTNWPTGSTAGGIAVVCNPQVMSNSGIVFGYGGAAATSQRALQQAVGFNYARALVGDGTTKIADNTALSFVGPRTVIIPISATAFQSDVDGVAGTPTASIPATGTIRARIGCGASTAAANFWLGEVSAIVVWSGTLSGLDSQYLYLWAAPRRGTA